MSISFPQTESDSTLGRLREQRLGQQRVGEQRLGKQRGRGTRASSAARIEANRRNCLKSTGPRTAEGKRRSSRNAMKHGLCRTLCCLPSECEATFLTFVDELERELQPATAMQRIVFNQIASLTWRLQRLPEAQTKLFAQELEKVDAGDDAGNDAGGAGLELKPSDVLARRFSDAPTDNGFALMERYERSMRSTLMRLMKQLAQMQKQRASTPYTEKELWEAQQAKYQQQLRDDEERYEQTRRRNAQREMMEARTRARDVRQAEDGSDASRTGAAAVQREAPDRAVCSVDDKTAARGSADALPRRGESGARSVRAKRTQSEPSRNVDSDAPAGKCTVAAHPPATKRTQCADAARGSDVAFSREPPPTHAPVASAAPVSIISPASTTHEERPHHDATADRPRVAGPVRRQDHRVVAGRQAPAGARERRRLARDR